MTYYSLGKQVLTGSQHVADAASVELAERIAAALNSDDAIDEAINQMTLFEPDRSPPLIKACRAYQASDQMICPCGKQWDVNDPDPPECNV